VITGAAEGIGRALAAEMGAHQYAITGIDVNAARVAETQGALPARGVAVNFLLGDLSQRADLEQIIAALIDGPPIDVLVNNAGINCVGAFASSDLASQRAVLDVNLRAPLQLTTALLRANHIAPGGALVFLSSLSHYVSYPGATVYAASKDGLTAYARSLAVSLAPQGIHVLVVYPGPTRTAHARRYSPDNRREARRMPPETLAALIYRALETRRRRLIPGFGNRVTAWLGQWLPAPVEWIMRRSIFDRL